MDIYVDSNQPAHWKSDQICHCPHEENFHPWLSKMHLVKILIRLANAQANLNLRWAHMSEGTFSVTKDSAKMDSLPYKITSKCII